MNDDKSTTIAGSFGHFILKENGIVYFYKEDDIAIDEATAIEFLEIIRQLDDSGSALILVVQGHRVEYTFSAQRTLLTSDLIGKLAYVIQTTTQRLTAELLQDMAKTLRSHYKVGIFQRVEKAEAWLLGEGEE
ncbi:MAG: hypothetical protein CL608_06750 [Anaerolineaceae bacterium]|nr:hypothetical protein [Anaerolineaceae bacterium]